MPFLAICEGCHDNAITSIRLRSQLIWFRSLERYIMMSNFEQQHLQSADSGGMDDQFERFELLSAYLDGEVTAKERSQVQQLLDTDPQFNQLYAQLSRLQREIPTIPVPASPVSSQRLSESVFEKVDRQNQSQRLVQWGGVVIATVVMGIIYNFYIEKQSLSRNFADVEAEPLTIALNRPVVDIPPSTQ
ncbi:MAG: anti-sigma factor family protein [cyanobacterium endosymbiont of Rhopalodia sterrenbergii]